MKKLLIFSGTTEGRALTEALRALPYDLTVCVATGYGESLQAAAQPDVHIHTGRMDETAMERFLRQGDYFLVIDATHPYAADVTANIRRACQAGGVRYLRLVRESGDESGCITVPDSRRAADFLCAHEGNVMLTTGSKELDVYTSIPDFPVRLYPRILPGLESLSRCLALGYAQRNIIAMQGPFSRELNEALIDQFDIRILVTKDGGRAGGFSEKIEAARSRHCRIVVIARPDDDGISYAEVLRILREEATI